MMSFDFAKTKKREKSQRFFGEEETSFFLKFILFLGTESTFSSTRENTSKSTKY